MTTMLVALLAQGWAVEARSSADEIRVAGKAAGASVTLEFRRRLWRHDAERAVLESALEEPERRKVAVENGAFAHAEPVGRPGRTEIRAMAEDGRTFEATLWSGAASTAAWARAGMRRIETAVEGLRELKQDSPRARRKLAAWRASGEASELPMAGEALTALAADVEQALAAKPGACPFLSGMDGRPFKVEGLPGRLATLLDLAARERDLLLLDGLEGLAEEVWRLARGGDGRRWSRAEPGFHRGLAHLRGVEEGRLAVALEQLEALVELGATASDCLASVEEDLEQQWMSFQAELGRLTEELSTLNP